MKILQIIPAPDHLYSEFDEGDEGHYFQRVKCLALVENDDGLRWVETISFIDFESFYVDSKFDNFLRACYRCEHQEEYFR